VKSFLNLWRPLSFILILICALCNLLCDVRGIRITGHNTVLLRLWTTCLQMDMFCDVHGKVSGFMFAVTVYEAVLGGVPCRYNWCTVLEYIHWRWCFTYKMFDAYILALYTSELCLGYFWTGIYPALAILRRRLKCE